MTTLESICGLGVLGIIGIVVYITIKRKIKREVKVYENVTYPREEEKEEDREGRTRGRGLRGRGLEGGGRDRGRRRVDEEATDNRSTTESEFEFEQSTEDFGIKRTDEKSRELLYSGSDTTQSTDNDDRSTDTEDSETTEWNSISVPDVEQVED